MYRPTMSRTLSMKRGSFDNLNVSVRCGCSAKARQIRDMAVWLNPLRLAIPRVLQWVASLGLLSKVRVITRSTSLSPIVRGAPGRGSSSRPSPRLATKRLRHFPTIPLETFNSDATSLLLLPLAHSKTIRARCANAWALVRRRVHDSSVSCSASVNSNSAFGRPVRIAASSYTMKETAQDLNGLFLTQDTRLDRKRSSSLVEVTKRHVQPVSLHTRLST